MSRHRSLYRCESCGAVQPRWSGRCGSCAEWNTLVEEQVVPLRTSSGRTPSSLAAPARPVPLGEVGDAGSEPFPTGVAELDRVLGGGLLPGSATLIGGEPGTGKSTLLLQAMGAMAALGRKCLLVAAEEVASQVRRRAVRLGADVPGVFVVEAVDLPVVEQAMSAVSPHVVVVDSVQAVRDPGIEPPPGSLAQVRGCAQSLVARAKATGAALVLVGHVTKEGTLAGPRALEHLVDTVLTFEGDRYSTLRTLRAVKHRFGPTGETGLFEMGENGLTSVADPSALFLEDRLEGAPGSAVAVTLEGHRPLLVEVQALVGRATTLPRRSVTGLDPGRVALLLAVLDRRAGLRVSDREVHVSVAGGARAGEPAADLPLCLALASSALGAPLPADMVAIGEVGLGGELRQARGVARRLAEAARLGFRWALVSASARKGHDELAGGQGLERVGGPGLRVVHAASVTEALEAALGEGPPAARLVASAHVLSRHGLTSAGARTLERGLDRGPHTCRTGRAASGGA
ncbi:MAG: DNA repair protein RadA [Acidimicrobiales bacterium]